MTKICSKCGLEKELREFNKKSSCKYGVSSRCRACDKEYKKQYNETHKEFLKERRAYFRNRDPELTKQRKRAEYQRNKEHYKIYGEKYRAENKKKIAERDKRYRETHIEQIQTQRQLAHWQLICKDVTKVENYNLALADNFVNWVQHHRLETHNSDGEKRLVQITAEELKALDMYYNRPAEELIWLTRAEHINIHREIN